MAKSRNSLPVLIALLGGIGRAPVAPGTVATFVAGIPFAVLLGLVPKPLSFIFLFLITLLACVASERASRELQDADPKEIVIDELVGYLVTMFCLPTTPMSLLLGFAAFRLFDIWKPWPIGMLDEKVKGGLGIVLDDVAAGVFASLLVWIILRVVS